MPKVIRKWMIDAYGEQDHNFRHGAGEKDEWQCQRKGALVNSFWAGRSVMEGLRRWSLRHWFRVILTHSSPSPDSDEADIAEHIYTCIHMRKRSK
jgi:hypothetical protein